MLTLCARCAAERASRGLELVVIAPGDPRDPQVSHGLCPACAERFATSDARDTSTPQERRDARATAA